MREILKTLVPLLIIVVLTFVAAASVDALGFKNAGNASGITAKDDETRDVQRFQKRLEFQERLEEKRRLRIEAREERLLLKVDDEEGTELELDDKEELEVQEGTTSGKIRIKAENGKTVVARNRVAARTNFPLSLDTDTNELIVTTPAGIKRVAVLPDVAIRNMLANGFIDVADVDEARDDTEEDATGSAELEDDATDSGEIQEVEDQIELTQTDDGLLAYEIKGYKTQRLLGLFQVKVNRTVYASADTGELLAIEQNFYNQILDALSI